MNTVFARTFVALCLVALPATAFASAKDAGEHHHATAKKEGKKASSKHHGHKSAETKHAAAATKKH